MPGIEVKVVGYKTQYGRNRYKVVSKETGETLDDAQGYGYKNASNAYAAWSWKQGKHSKKKKKKSNSGTLPECVSVKTESGIEQANTNSLIKRMEWIIEDNIGYGLLHPETYSEKDVNKYESEARHELNILKKAIRNNPNVILQENHVTEMYEIVEEK